MNMYKLFFAFLFGLNTLEGGLEFFYILKELRNV